MSAKKAAAEKEPVKVFEKAEIKKVETLVYVGPTISGVATHNMFMNNGITNELKAAIEKEPAFANLIVPVSALASTAKSIADKSGAAYVFYKKVASFKA